MKDYTINNAIALLEELTHNGKFGDDTLYAWFLGEQFLIERTIMELDTSQPAVEADAQKPCRFCGGANETNFNFCGMCGRDLQTA